MAVYGISIRDTASPFLKRLASDSLTQELVPAIGEAGKRVMMDHFTVKQSDPAAHATAGRLGARSSGLFADFARATAWSPSSTGVDLTVSHVAARQRYLGGRIKPVNATFLTIPANSHAYGRRAREVGVTLKFMFAPDPTSGRMRPALVAPDAVTKPTGKARKDGTRRERTIRPSGVYYWLVRQTTQNPDPTVLPTDNDLFKGIEAAAGAFLDKFFSTDTGESTRGG